MKKYLIITLLSCLGYLLPGQTIVDGTILDQETNTPIPYVNVGVSAKEIGTVSNEAGGFTLEGIDLEDEIIISSIGYETIRIPVGDLLQEPVIHLIPKDYSLNTVEVKATRFDGAEKILGVRNRTRGLSIGFDGTQLGTEIGTPIPIDQPTYLKSANFVLNHAKGDSLLFRINIYSFTDGLIGANLLTENILILEKQRKGTISIDLTNYNIILENDVLLSLEWLRDFDETGNRGITFDTKKGKKQKGIYTRWASNSSFKLLDHNAGKNLCFYFIGKPVK